MRFYKEVKTYRTYCTSTADLKVLQFYKEVNLLSVSTWALIYTFAEACWLLWYDRDLWRGLWISSHNLYTDQARQSCLPSQNHCLGPQPCWWNLKKSKYTVTGNYFSYIYTNFKTYVVVYEWSRVLDNQARGPWFKP